jgi:nucleoside-diphosphate-sugar epimerase
MRRWLVTGATGFIGRRFVKKLAESGDEIVAISRSGVPGTVQADVLDSKQMAEVVAQSEPTHLALLAWTTEHGVFWEDPANETWRAANIDLAKCFLRGGGQAILGVGSCAEYAWGGALLTEAATPIRPATRYGAAKAQLWTEIERACARHGASAAWARVFFVYGVGEHPSKLVSSLVRSAIKDEKVALRDPDRRLDLIHVDDVAGALAVLAERGATGAYNVATGTGAPAREVAALAGARLAAADTVNMAEPQPDVIGENTRLLKLGWSPAVTLAQGVAQLRRAYLGETA